MRYKRIFDNGNIGIVTIESDDNELWIDDEESKLLDKDGVFIDKIEGELKYENNIQDKCFLKKISAQPSKLGVGTLLMNIFSQIISSSKVPIIWTESVAVEEGVPEFYLQCGFVPDANSWIRSIDQRKYMEPEELMVQLWTGPLISQTSDVMQMTSGILNKWKPE